MLRGLLDEVRAAAGRARGRRPRPTSSRCSPACAPARPPARPIRCWPGCCPTSTPRTPSSPRACARCTEPELIDAKDAAARRRCSATLPRGRRPGRLDAEQAEALARRAQRPAAGARHRGSTSPRTTCRPEVDARTSAAAASWASTTGSRRCRTRWSHALHASDARSARGARGRCRRRLDAVLASTATTSTRSSRTPASDHPDEACGSSLARPGQRPAGAGSSDARTRRARRRSTSSTPATCCSSTRRWTTADEEPVVIYHSHTAPRPTRRAPTSPTPPSRRRTTCWCRPASPAPTSSGRSGSSTGWWPRSRSRSSGIVDGVVAEEDITSSTSMPSALTCRHPARTTCPTTA